MSTLTVIINQLNVDDGTWQMELVFKNEDMALGQWQYSFFVEDADFYTYEGWVSFARGEVHELKFESDSRDDFHIKCVDEKCEFYTSPNERTSACDSTFTCDKKLVLLGIHDALIKAKENGVRFE